MRCRGEVHLHRQAVASGSRANRSQEVRLQRTMARTKTPTIILDKPAMRSCLSGKSSIERTDALYRLGLKKGKMPSNTNTRQIAVKISTSIGHRQKNEVEVDSGRGWKASEDCFEDLQHHIGKAKFALMCDVGRIALALSVRTDWRSV